MKNHAMAQTTDGAMIGSKQTAALLGVSVRTLYAYVSRGKIGRTVDATSGDSLFNRAEVLEFVRRRDRGRSPKTAARASLNFGLPVLDSHICAIKAGRPWFRGMDAIAYSETATLEDTAALLWGVDELSRVPAGDSEVFADGPFLQRYSLWLLRQAAGASFRETPTHDALVTIASRILHAAVSLAVGSCAWSGTIHQALGSAWGLAARRHDVLRRALVLHADHELNPSSFVVRCTASTLASPYAAILAGCCAASGTKHANFTDAHALIAQVRNGEDSQGLLQAYQHAGHALPGFNHPLYPKGDPRATAILHALRVGGSEPTMAAIDRFLDLARTEYGMLPKNDFALAALAHVLGLPADACPTLFVIARLVGWNAHALEQYHSPFVIRPRAQYVPD
jgi:citrate synthase